MKTSYLNRKKRRKKMETSIYTYVHTCDRSATCTILHFTNHHSSMAKQTPRITKFVSLLLLLFMIINITAGTLIIITKNKIKINNQKLCLL